MVSNHFAASRNDARWWDTRTTLHRFVSDLIASEFRRLQPGRPNMPAHTLPENARIDADLGADSLELMSLGTSLAEAIHLHESGIEDYLLARRSVADWTAIAAQGLDFYSDKLTFRTSGSTGMPKSCTHTLAALQQETGYLAGLFRGRRRILAAVPCHHIYGFLFTILLPRALGIGPDAVIDIRDGLPSALARRAQPGDLVVAYPEFWDRAAHGAAFGEDVIGVTSSGPCPDAVSEAATGLGLAALFQIYGASETGGLGWRASHRSPYTLFPYWSVDLERPDSLTRIHPDGHGEAVAMPDVLKWSGPAEFHVMARRDEAVQVGGNNVFPEQVRQVLLRHPDVSEAAVRLMRPEEGSRLKAFIVPRDGVCADQALHSALTAWVNAQLPPAARPKAFTCGDTIPRAANGKACDWPLDTHPHDA